MAAPMRSTKRSGSVGVNIGTNGPAAWGGRLQLIQAPPWKAEGENNDVFSSTVTVGQNFRQNVSCFRATATGGAFDANRSKFASTGSLGNAARAQMKDSSKNLHVEEVRALISWVPEEQKHTFDHMMMRLKSRAAKQEADATRIFLADYRATEVPSAASDQRIKGLLSQATERAETLRRRSEEMQREADKAEQRLDHLMNYSVTCATEAELHSMAAFARSQRRILEDKQTEELQKDREVAQVNLSKCQKNLQAKMTELRDYKVLIREYTRVRLEKVELSLGRHTDGQRVRACVREMIRHGAQRILQKLENLALPIEPWMREVLLNSCHLEIRIEDEERKLMQLRRDALGSVEGGIQEMSAETQEKRMNELCRETVVSMQEIRGEAHTRRLADATYRGLVDLPPPDVEEAPVVQPRGSDDKRRTTVSSTMLAEVRVLENNITSLRRLVMDMQRNAASIVCTRIRQAEKSGNAEQARELVAWGTAVLTLIVSQEFAKRTNKELQAGKKSKMAH